VVLGVVWNRNGVVGSHCERAGGGADLRPDDGVALSRFCDEVQTIQLGCAVTAMSFARERCRGDSPTQGYLACMNHSDGAARDPLSR
jgi:hypothetical protein